MSKATERLVFYNSLGYPHNFKLNDNIWKGNIYFEPNSANLFKSLSMYVLESVPNIEYNGELDLINNEIYSDLGMSIFKYTNENINIDNIKVVNESSNFYTKWIYGNRLNRLFPIGTMVSFDGIFINDGTNGWDDLKDNYFNVLLTKKNAIMIATNTDNDTFDWAYDSNINNLKIKSHNAISIPEFNRSISSLYNPDDNMKISIVGSENSDSVVEIYEKSTTYSRIFDYDLSSTISGDTINLDVELFTERPLLYSGNISLVYENSQLIMEFLNGRNSNLEVGDKFIVENLNGNHLLNSNEYTIEEVINEEYIGTYEIIFDIDSYIGNDGLYIKEYYIKYPKELNLKLGDKIKFKNNIDSNYNYNIGLNIRILSIDSESDSFINIAKVDQKHIQIYDNKDVYIVYKDYQKNKVVVSSSIDNSTFDNLEPVRCMAISNILSYEIFVNNNGINDTLNVFVNNHKQFFNVNGLDLYNIEDKLYIEGMYSGSKEYFNCDLTINNSGQTIIADYSDLSGNTSIYNFILKEGDLYNERYNMTDDLSRSYIADIILDLSDDIQDYGFQIEINGIQYYTEFIDNSGTTSKTYETILNFINIYESVLNNNGFNISSSFNIISGQTECHLYINGQEPNVDINELKVKVNRNSTYSINEISNNRLMLVSNYIKSDVFNFINHGYTTSMVINLSGSQYPSNNNNYNIIGINDNIMELSYQGAFYTDLNVDLNIISNEYLRKPRESNEEDIYYRFRWEDDTEDSIFLYDLSGENLVPWGNNPLYEYKGIKPLNIDNDIVILNTEPNKNKDYVLIPGRQQTIFDKLEFKLNRFDDDNIDLLPEPIQVFMGYKTDMEGVNERILMMERVDNVIYQGTSNGIDLYFTFSGNVLTIISTSTIDLLDMGFKAGRKIQIKLDDNKPYTTLLFEDYQEFTIKSVNKNKLIIDGKFKDFTTLNEEFNFIIEQLPEVIGEFKLMGQTEIEDERLESNMKLLGIDLTEEHEYIFEESNINEEGNDYILLNKKRKEMMENYKEIYDYIGSYRAIFNTLNFFGYEDIELVEYYRNIDEKSPLYGKLKQIIIPNLTDRLTEGWSYSEDLSKRIGYKKTNLLNLTYRITDEEGNNQYLYTLADVQYKLNGLKKWLRKNILPVNSNIEDITGVSESVGTLWTRFDPSVNVIDQITTEKTTAINFNYIASRNFNTSWNISVRFYTVNGFIPKSFDLKIKTYVIEKGDDQLKPQQEYNLIKNDLEPFNFIINWEEDLYDIYFNIETLYYNDNGLGKIVNRMYKLENKDTYYYDEKKNYILIENNLDYKYQSYVQNNDAIYLFDNNGNYYKINK